MANIQPELPEVLMLFAPAYHAAPPVVAMSFSESQSSLIVPVPRDKVAAVPADEAFIFTAWPEAPVAVSDDSVVVVADVSLIFALG